MSQKLRIEAANMANAIETEIAEKLSRAEQMKKAAKALEDDVVRLRDALNLIHELSGAKKAAKPAAKPVAAPRPAVTPAPVAKPAPAPAAKKPVAKPVRPRKISTEQLKAWARRGAYLRSAISKIRTPFTVTDLVKLVRSDRKAPRIPRAYFNTLTWKLASRGDLKIVKRGTAGGPHLYGNVSHPPAAKKVTKPAPKPAAKRAKPTPAKKPATAGAKS